MKWSKVERLAVAVLLVIFTWSTWRGLTQFYSGDDMMNMYGAWAQNPWRLTRAILLFWVPVYRPLGGGIYRLFYTVFGFHPEPLYLFCWLMLVANLVLAYRWFRIVSATVAEALIALSLILVHGSFQDLYISAGTIYDRLWFLFTVLGLTFYARWDRRFRLSIPAHFGLVLICILSMTSKESGVALPVLLFLYEVIFHYEDLRKAPRAWLRRLGPLFGVLGLIALISIYRVNHTPELQMTPAYRPKLSIGLWFTRVAEYFGILAYGHLPFTAVTAAILLGLLVLAAILLRNRAMIFGLLLFIVTITPVALIAGRPGYVLYVPELGLGLALAALIGVAARRIPLGEAAALVVVTAATTYSANRMEFYPTELSPERRLTEQFRRDYPTLPPTAKMLFVTDAFPRSAWDLAFNLRLLYHDQSMVVHRLEAPPDQQPDPAHPISYDHVFVVESGHYLELDNTDPKESLRLHILRDYAAGLEMDVHRRDYPGYIVSGFGASNDDPVNPILWTDPNAKMKFSLYPAQAVFSAKVWVPDFVAKPAGRSLTVLVNGKEVGVYPLTKDGMNDFAFLVAPGLITLNGFTIVEMNVSNPYKEAGGKELGVVFSRAGFRYGGSH